MRAGIGRGRSRDDHWPVACEIWRIYDRAKEDSLKKGVMQYTKESDDDFYSLNWESQKTDVWFLEKFEKRFLSQGTYENRNIFQTLELAWELLRMYPRIYLVIIRRYGRLFDKYYFR